MAPRSTHFETLLPLSNYTTTTTTTTTAVGLSITVRIKVLNVSEFEKLSKVCAQ